MTGTTKTCWMKLVPFYEVGNTLLSNFDKAFKVSRSTFCYFASVTIKSSLLWFHQVIASNDGNGLKTVDHEKHHQMPKNRLIYSEPSPNFCKADHTVGSLGTKGRVCDPSDHEKCNAFCCDRGYFSELMTVETSCNCVFKWCCEVKCDKCSEEKEIRTCNWKITSEQFFLVNDQCQRLERNQHWNDS